MLNIWSLKFLDGKRGNMVIVLVAWILKIVMDEEAYHGENATEGDIIRKAKCKDEPEDLDRQETSSYGPHCSPSEKAVRPYSDDRSDDSS